MNASFSIRRVAIGSVTVAAVFAAAPGVTAGTESEVTVVVAQPVELTIEWLALSASSQKVLAARTAVVDKQITIQVEPTADRFVRFSRPGTSPVTMPAARLVGPAPWRLPDLGRRRSPVTTAPMCSRSIARANIG
jgi:hypothetical protein